MKLTSNEPFWLIKNGLLNSYPSLQEDIETDILIIGAGITGSLIAHQCMEDGFRTAIIDRREVGNGSTSATTSMLQYEIDIPLHKLIELIGEEGAVLNYRACAKAIDEIGRISNKVRSQCGFAKKESLYFTASKKDVVGLKKEFEVRKRHGFQVKWLESDEILDKFEIDNSFGGILSEQGGSIDAFQLAHDILGYNHKKGLRIFDKTHVADIQYHKTGVTLIMETGFKIRTQKVIYCNGYESTEIIKEKFVKLLSTYALIGEQSTQGLDKVENTLFWDTSSPYHYMRTTDDKRLLIGGGDVKFKNSAKRDTLLTKKAGDLEKYVNKILPEYNFIPDFAWAGTFGETKDGLPYIGIHPDFENSYFVLGFGGNGITFSVIGMEMISKFLKGEESKMTPYFRFGR